ncbi:hypothetical protein IJJ27_00660 [bacterium]|nr:hypothetical protein [bacterium]
MNKAPRSYWQTFFSQSTFHLLCNAFASFLSFLSNYVIVHLLSVADYGEYATIMAYVALSALPLSIVSLVVTKNLAGRAPSKRRAYYHYLHCRLLATVKHYWWLLLLSLSALSVWLALAAHFQHHASVIVALILIVLNSLILWWTAQLHGGQYFATVSLLAVVSMAIRLLLSYISLKISPTLDSLYCGFVLAFVLPSGLYYAAVSRHRSLSLCPRGLSSWSGEVFTRRHWQPAIALVIITAMLINCDVLAVKIFTDAHFAGLYGLYSLFAKIILYASQPLINVAYTHFNAHVKQRQKVFWLSLLLIGGFTAVMSLLYAFFPQTLILLVGQADYLSLSPILYLAALFGGLYTALMLAGQYLVATNNQLIKFGLLSPLLQIVAIAFYHQTPLQIMMVNIIVSSATLLFFILGRRRAA